jgi:hypothetical protein
VVIGNQFIVDVASIDDQTVSALADGTSTRARCSG